MATLPALLARLDADERVRGRQWERLCVWFLGRDPAYRALLRRVWLWREWPGRWGGDAGIDLVAEDAEGHLWAVQAKCYDPSYSVTKRDLDTFLSESSRPQFSYRLLISTTDLLAPNARRVVEGSEKPVGLLLRGDLERAQVAWPDHPDDLRAPAPAPKTPRPHQQEALDAVLAGFQGHDRGQLIMACGTGKTLVGLWASDALGATRTLVLLPSLSLLAQVLGEWTANATEPFPFLPVCSDPTVRGEDEWVSTTADLGFPVTTSPAEIAAFLRKRGRRVVFSTYQSSPRIAEAQALRRVPGFDLVIADEAHRTAGETSTDFATILDPDLIKARRRLFMTATPRFFTGRVLKAAEEADLEVASMDDEATYGPNFHRLTFGEAISRDLLSDYRVVIVGVDDKQVHDMATTARLVTLEGTKERTDARTLAAHIGLAKTMRRFDLRRTITFHGRVKGARDFATRLPQVIAWMPADQAPEGRLWAEHVSGDMPTGQRTTRLDRLRHLDPGERGLLSNARCLAEGVDVPTLDGVAFIDPKGSQTDIVQAVGRAIRKAADKTLGTIVLPVFVEHADDPERALDASAFKPVWTVLRALRDQDEQLAEALDGLRRRQGREGVTTITDLPKLDIDPTVGAAFVEALRAEVVERTTSVWPFWFGLLERFTLREGHAAVPAEHREDGLRLGMWVAEQRHARRDGTLAPERTAHLSALPGWTWDPQADEWEQGFAAVVAFAKQHGHSQPTVGFRAGKVDVGRWVVTRRRDYGRGLLSADRVARLEALPEWSWDPGADQWDAGFAALTAFAKREGHAAIPAQHIEAGHITGKWASKQRSAYRAGRLSADRVARLEALPGWAWDPRGDDWEEDFAALLQFVSTHGHARVARGTVIGRVRLGEWANAQRHLYRKGQVSEDRVRRLEAVPGWSWEPFGKAWDRFFLILEAYAAREGHSQVPRSHKEDGVALGIWVNTQRAAHREGRLAPDRAARLEALPRWIWDAPTPADAWERAFALTKRYAAQHGHTRVPRDSQVDGFGLGSWIVIQRAAYRAAKLDPARATRLEALPGWRWDSWQDAWESSFALLQEFVAREGSALVPQTYKVKGVGLGAWVAGQRARYRKGTLEADRIARLEALPGWEWSPGTGPHTNKGR